MGIIDAVLGDLTLERADALVNAANSTLLGGSGVDGALHAAAGQQLLAACRTARQRYPSGLPVGEAVATQAGRLPAKWVIHTVGPNRHAGQTSEVLLTAAYTSSLDVAAKLGATTVAFPAVGAGAYGWDAETAARVAVLAVAGHQRDGIERVRFVLFSRRLYDAFNNELVRLVMTALPYGSWPSPLHPENLTRSSLRLSPGLIEGDFAYWAEGDPEQLGRVSLWCRDPEGEISELTPQAYVRTAVNEYGGGDWTAADGLVAYSSWPDGQVFLIEAGRPPRPIAPGEGLRYAALWLDPGRRLLLAVREDHRQDGEPAQAIVALNLDADNADGGQVLASGCDFYAHPSLSPGGQLAWCEWNHPNMPWDSTRIMVAPLSDPARRTLVAGSEGISALYPSWADDNSLIYLSDASGFWNFCHWDGASSRALLEAATDFCGPLWVLASVPYTIIDTGRIGCTWTVDGFAKVGVLTFGDGRNQLQELPSDAVVASVTGRGERALALLGYPDRPSELVEFDWLTAQATTLRVTSTFRLEPEMISRAEPFSWESEDGEVFAWFYPPTNAGYIGPSGELPPVQVWSHGGPTANSGPDFSLATQFWTSRGIGILDVNYSGSTGYGRSYRERLHGQWGIADVRDCVAGALALAEAGLADRNRLSIRGGSAGGFTTLAALTTSDVFAAGISLYGVGDLEALATDSHKFEKHYLDGLVAPYPSERQTYLERSPIHHLDGLSCPMLILQGADDRVVPPSQAAELAAAVRAKRLPVELVIFDGEGHGFRRAETIVTVAQRCLDFLAKVHGFALPRAR